MSDTLLTVLFSLSAAVTVGTFSLFVRRGQVHGNAVTGVLIGLIVTFPFMAGATAWLWEPGWGHPRAWALFAAAGLLGPSLGRVFYFQSIHYLGVARAVPLAATLPLVAAGVGIGFLGERPGAVVLAGTVLIVAGTMLITRRGEGGTPYERRHLWIPFAGVLGFSVSHLFRKVAVGLVPSPLLGITVMSAAGMASLYFLGRLLPEAHRPRLDAPKAWLFYGACGWLNAASVLLHLYGLRFGDLTVVIPLSATAPFWALLWSALLLRDLERVTRLILAGTVLVVAGGTLIAWRAL